MKRGDVVELSAAATKISSYAALKNKHGTALRSDKAGSWQVGWMLPTGLHAVWMKRTHLKILKPE
jgi:hypothetical protein